MKCFIFVAALFLFAQYRSVAQMVPGRADSLAALVLSKEKLQEDFNYLRKVLEETHPGLYRYSSREAMKQKMDSIAHSLNSEMPFYTYYQLLSAFVAGIRCAHTYIVPAEKIEEYFNMRIKTLPYEVSMVQKRAFVVLNGTADTVVKPGFELLAINGHFIDQLLPRLYDHIWSDGYITTAKTNQLTGVKFGLFYYMLIERPDTFLLTMRNQAGHTFEVKAIARPFKEYNPQFFKNPVNKDILAIYKPKNEKDRKKGWRLELLPQPHTALLRIRSFGGGKNAQEAARKMRDFMNTTVATLQKKKIRHLIVDLRSNSGGWDIQGVELFTYLMKDTTPVRYYQQTHAITDSSSFLQFSDLSAEDKAGIKNELVRQVDGTFIAQEAYNEALKIQYPKPNRFTGNLYFLINGGSASATAEFTAVAHSNKLGVFIGSETGGAYEGGNGGSFLHFQLPNSHMRVGTPLLYYKNAVQAPVQKGRGTLPDYYIASSIADILQGTDAQLAFALDLIRKSK